MNISPSSSSSGKQIEESEGEHECELLHGRDMMHIMPKNNKSICVCVGGDDMSGGDLSKDAAVFRKSHAF
jgi:hypothetical protein